jgi:hypothetical protein
VALPPSRGWLSPDGVKSISKKNRGWEGGLAPALTEGAEFSRSGDKPPSQPVILRRYFSTFMFTHHYFA